MQLLLRYTLKFIYRILGRKYIFEIENKKNNKVVSLIRQETSRAEYNQNLFSRFPFLPRTNRSKKQRNNFGMCVPEGGMATLRATLRIIFEIRVHVYILKRSMRLREKIAQ